MGIVGDWWLENWIIGELGNLEIGELENLGIGELSNLII